MSVPDNTIKSCFHKVTSFYQGPLYVGLVWHVGKSREAAQCSTSQANDTNRLLHPDRKACVFLRAQLISNFSLTPAEHETGKAPRCLTQILLLNYRTLGPYKTSSSTHSMNHRTTTCGSQNAERLQNLQAGTGRDEKRKGALLLHANSQFVKQEPLSCPRKQSKLHYGRIKIFLCQGHLKELDRISKHKYK